MKTWLFERASCHLPSFSVFLCVLSFVHVRRYISLISTPHQLICVLGTDFLIFEPFRCKFSFIYVRYGRTRTRTRRSVVNIPFRLDFCRYLHVFFMTCFSLCLAAACWEIERQVGSPLSFFLDSKCPRKVLYRFQITRAEFRNPEFSIAFFRSLYSCQNLLFDVALGEHFQLLGLISFLHSLSKALSTPTHSFVFVFGFIKQVVIFFLLKTLLPLLQNMHCKKWLVISCVRFYFTTSLVRFKAPIFHYFLLVELRFIRIHKK